jgi:bifunctional non-homologous end joining protein LigD
VPKRAKLSEYRKKRQFDRTPEPSGVESSVNTGAIFVVQKHSATRLHYDFRLAIGGTLKSWAVPKGPSLNPNDKRLAVHVEDHPLGYADFEGNIPAGSYGAGTVMVWDRGTFEPQGNLDAAGQLERGEIKFMLNGEKLRGSFVLVKLKRSAKGNEWLMIKHQDAAADPHWNIDDHDGSALTGRGLEEIQQQLAPKRAPAPLHPDELPNARKAAMPAKLGPMLATLSDRPFSDPHWLFEIKWDGVRALAFIHDGDLKLRARRGQDITANYPELHQLPNVLTASDAILDGEIAVLDDRGRSNFETLQERMHVRYPSAKLVSAFPVVFLAFDLLYCDGYDLRESPLVKRKQLLKKLLHPSANIRYSDHQLEEGRELFELAKENGLEGIVAKRIDSRYVSDRSPDWLKLKTAHTLDAVIGGWTAARGPGLPFGSLLLGLYRGKKLHFAGHVGSGFKAQSHKEIFAKLQALHSDRSPFAEPPDRNEKPTWVRPELVVRVRYASWTSEHRLRHPVFLAIRADAKPVDCSWQLESASPSEQKSESRDVVQAPPVVGKVLSSKAQIECELFKGRSENVTLELDGQRFRVSNLNKVYFPESGYSKRDLLAYYYRMADCILPFLEDRPLVLRRYPDGIKGQAFFQKNLSEVHGLPDWLKTVPIDSEHRGEEIHYAIANDRATLLYLTGLGCIDHNPWSSRTADLDHPDYFFFDLDPSDGTDFSVVVTIAKALYDQLRELKLRVFIKASGATGMHLYLPVQPVYTYEQLRTFAEIVTRMVSAEHPSLVTSERSVAKRPAGRVLIDVQQNAHGRPLAAPYSVRAFPKAPVSAPLQPAELQTGLDSSKLNIKTLSARLEKHGDLWRDFWAQRQTLDHAIEALSTRIDTNFTKRSR